MSSKRLLPLVLILLILGVLAVWLKREQPSSRLAEEVGLERLLPTTFRAEAVSGIELSLGTQPEDVVRLRKHEGNWVLPSRFEAPGNSTKIQQLLAQLSSLEGELRADSPALLEDFQLKDDQALSLKLYTDHAKTPALTLLVGKTSGNNSFMRRSGDTKVYAVNLNVQTLAGLSSTSSAQSLTAKPWLDLRLQNVPREQITAVELQAPTRTLRFTTSPAATNQAAPPAWTLAEPVLSYSVKSEAVESLVTTLRTIQGDDVVDPANLVSYGLEAAPYRAVLVLQGSAQEAQQVTLLIGTEVPEKHGSRYARLSSGGPVYVLPQWTWQRLFPTLGTLLDLRLLQVSEDEVVQVAFQQDGETWEVARDTTEVASTWHLVGDTEATLDETTLHTLLGTLTQLSAEDLPAVPPVSTGLEQPALQITLTLRDGRTAPLLLGQAISPEGGGYYASRGNTSEVAIVSASMQRTLTDAVTRLKPGAPAPEKSRVIP